MTVSDSLNEKLFDFVDDKDPFVLGLKDFVAIVGTSVEEKTIYF